MNPTHAMPIPFVTVPAGNAARSRVSHWLAGLRLLVRSQPRLMQDWLPSSSPLLHDIGFCPDQVIDAPSSARDWVMWRQ